MDSTLILGLVCLCGVPVMAIFIGVVALIAIYFRPIENTNTNFHQEYDPDAYAEAVEAFTDKIRRILRENITEDERRRRIDVAAKALLYLLPDEVGELTIKPGWNVKRFRGEPRKTVTWTLKDAEEYANIPRTHRSK